MVKPLVLTAPLDRASAYAIGRDTNDLCPYRRGTIFYDDFHDGRDERERSR